MPVFRLLTREKKGEKRRKKNATMGMQHLSAKIVEKSGDGLEEPSSFVDLYTALLFVTGPRIVLLLHQIAGSRLSLPHILTWARLEKTS